LVGRLVHSGLSRTKVPDIDGQRPCGEGVLAGQASARATVLAVLRDGGELAFCDHHSHRYRATLTPLAQRFERHVDLDEALAFVPSLAGR
jgi:hypothetical protein